MRCWGANGSRQLGDGTSMNRNVPTPVIGLTGASALAAGWFHSCAALASSVSCWGGNQHGVLGRGTSDSTFYYLPGPAIGLGRSDQVVSHSISTCARAGTAVSCWGGNDLGVLGIGAAGSDVLSPAPVGEALSQISVAATGGCGVNAAGVAYCWGNNQNYQTGDGVASDTTRLSPVPVAPPM